MCLRPGVVLFHKDPNKPATEMNAIWLCEECGEVFENSTKRLMPGRKMEEFDRSVRVKHAHGYCKCPGCEMCMRDSDLL